MNSEHAELFMKNGSMRIGTLYEFRNTELHGNEIGDAYEGVVRGHTRIADWHNSNFTSQHASQFSPAGSSGISLRAGESISFGAGGGISFGAGETRMQNVTLTSTLNAYDMYILCLAQSYREEDASTF